MRRRPRLPPLPALAAGAAIAALSVLAALPAAAAGAAPRIESVTLSPRSFGPGEEVEALLVLKDAAGLSPFVVDYGASRGAGAGAEDPEIRSIGAARAAAGWEIRIRFVPWSPGPGAVPAKQVRGVALPRIPYEAASYLASPDPMGRDLAPPRPQRDPPGTGLYLYGFAGAALALLVAALAAAAYLLPAARSLIARLRAGQAFRRLARDLDFLASGSEEADPVPYYAALARIVRLYLARRIEPGAAALTASEVARLPDAAFPRSGLKDSAAGLLAETERVRYAGERPPAAAMRSAAARAKAIGAAAEEALDARV